MSYLYIFWAKKYFDIWNQHRQICQTAKFREKLKMSKFGTKNALFEVFLLSGYYFKIVHELQSCKGRRRPFTLAPNCHFHQPQRYLEISLEITAESSPLHVGNSYTLTRNLPIASGQPLSYISPYLKSAPSNMSNFKILRKNQYT